MQLPADTSQLDRGTRLGHENGDSLCGTRADDSCQFFVRRQFGILQEFSGVIHLYLA